MLYTLWAVIWFCGYRSASTVSDTEHQPHTSSSQLPPIYMRKQAYKRHTWFYICCIPWFLIGSLCFHLILSIFHSLLLNFSNDSLLLSKKEKCSNSMYLHVFYSFCYCSFLVSLNYSPNKRKKRFQFFV